MFELYHRYHNTGYKMGGFPKLRVMGKINATEGGNFYFGCVVYGWFTRNQGSLFRLCYHKEYAICGSKLGPTIFENYQIAVGRG